MKSATIRVFTMVITLLFGFISGVFYVYTEINRVMHLESMEGYFNVKGMFFVVCTLIIICTNIQSIIFHIKILMYLKKNTSNDLIDEALLEDRLTLTKIPSKLLRTSNMIFSLTFLAYVLFLFVDTLFFEEEAVKYFLLVFLSIPLLAGFIISIDAFKIKKMILSSPQKKAS